MLCSLCTVGTYSTGSGKAIYIYMQIKRRGFGPLWGISIVLLNMPKQKPHFPDLNQVGRCKQDFEWIWRITDSIACLCMRKTASVLQPLTCPLYRVQALPRRARAASARREPIRLGQVSHCRDSQRGMGTLRIHMAASDCVLPFKSIGM